MAATEVIHFLLRLQLSPMWAHRQWAQREFPSTCNSISLQAAPMKGARS